MKLTSDSLLLKFLGYKIELFNIEWDTDMTESIRSGISVWFLLLLCIAKTGVCLFIPLVYIISISCLLSPAACLIGFMNGLVVLPDSSVGFVLLALFMPNALILMLVIAMQSSSSNEYTNAGLAMIRSMFGSIFSLRWVSFAFNYISIPFIVLGGVVLMGLSVIANPIKIEVQQDAEEDD